MPAIIFRLMLASTNSAKL